MWKSLLPLCAVLLLADAAAAEVNYRDFRMRSWGYRAERCGEIYQEYLVFEIEHLLGDLKVDMWKRARDLGAREDEIAILEKRFESGRKKALEDPYIQNTPEHMVESAILGRKGSADWNYKFCTLTLN